MKTKLQSSGTGIEPATGFDPALEGRGIHSLLLVLWVANTAVFLVYLGKFGWASLL